jgi:hypothetical protein
MPAPDGGFRERMKGRESVLIKSKGRVSAPFPKNQEKSFSDDHFQDFFISY